VPRPRFPETDVSSVSCRSSSAVSSPSPAPALAWPVPPALPDCLVLGAYPAAAPTVPLVPLSPGNAGTEHGGLASNSGGSALSRGEGSVPAFSGAGGLGWGARADGAAGGDAAMATAAASWRTDGIVNALGDEAAAQTGGAKESVDNAGTDFTEVLSLPAILLPTTGESPLLVIWAATADAVQGGGAEAERSLAASEVNNGNGGEGAGEGGAG